MKKLTELLNENEDFNLEKDLGEILSNLPFGMRNNIMRYPQKPAKRIIEELSKKGYHIVHKNQNWRDGWY